jgi:myo-inositol-1(or 4)-monophosphatase
MTDLARLLSVAQHAVGIGTELVRTSVPHEVRAKGDRDIVTDVDVKIEQEIRSYLRQATPDIGFLGEEEGQVADANQETVWTLDPIDGTSNFAHRIPLCAVSLALVNQHRPLVAAISLPFLDLRYHAVQGQGAFVNDDKIRTSRTSDLGKAIISIGDYAVGTNAQEKNKPRLRLTALLAERIERVRMFGSAAIDLVWVAEGRTDATVILANKPWDTAAGVLIAREAGAIVTDAHGQPHTFASAATIAASPGVADDLDTLVQSLYC